MRRSARAALCPVVIAALAAGGQGCAPALPVPPAEGITVTLPGGATLEMVPVPAGTFVMGDPEPGGRSNRGPAHRVAVERGFYLGRYEVTQGQWEGVMGTRPWAGQRYVREDPNRPAVYVSWDDAQEFLKRLNAASRDSLYRLPTEEEWEYACRAGTTTPWSSGDDESALGAYAWYRGNLREPNARPVGMKLPNPWGLYDTHGNVWEWVEDRYAAYPGGRPIGEHARDRVNRGGSFYDPAGRVRSAYRNHDDPSCRSADLGLRLARAIR